MQRERRIGGYALCRDADRVLLVRASADSYFPGVWQVPGGGVDHGEHPATTVAREFTEETGLAAEIIGLRAVLADVWRIPELDLDLHTDRVIYEVRATGGTLRTEADGGTTDLVEWVPVARLPELALMPFTAELLGQPVTALAGPPERASECSDAVPAGGEERAAQPSRPAAEAGTLKRRGASEPERLGASGPRKHRQRFAAYGLVTDAAGRILLTRIRRGYPGAGRWHLPGGGTDHGEQPVSGLLRELVEEAGQLGRVTDLLTVSHLHNPAALGPEGFPLDWHGVRVIYRVVVDMATEPVVTEAAGSTDAAAWFTLAEASRLPATDVAVTALAHLTSQNSEK